MACPYFEPLTLRAEGKALRPLRNFWSGACHAAGDAPFNPDENLLGECCNMGYARDRCPRFPQGSGPDSVRFHIARDADQMILVSFAIEKDHYPESRGVLPFSRKAVAFLTGHPNPLLEAQARAYVAGYLRRRPESA